jgi:hypothetical protein
VNFGTLSIFIFFSIANLFSLSISCGLPCRAPHEAAGIRGVPESEVKRGWKGEGFADEKRCHQNIITIKSCFYFSLNLFSLNFLALSLVIQAFSSISKKVQSAEILSPQWGLTTVNPLPVFGLYQNS